jgi:hypothetical protein
VSAEPETFTPTRRLVFDFHEADAPERAIGDWAASVASPCANTR